MAGMVLIVDAVAINRIVLKVKLATAYYDVAQARSADEAMEQIAATKPDLVLLGSQLTDKCASELCTKIKSSSIGRDIPVVLITADNNPQTRLAALSAGADDVLSKPLDDIVLLARLRSLLRARDVEQELKLRDGTKRALGLAEHPAVFDTPAAIGIVVAGKEHEPSAIVPLFSSVKHRLTALTPRSALVQAEQIPQDVYVLLLTPESAETQLSLLSDLRARPSTRHAAIILVLEPNMRNAAARALDLGASDLMSNGFDVDELIVRLGKQITRKRTADNLRSFVHDGLKAAVTDPLTGLYNRRYAIPHVTRVAERAADKGLSYAVMVADMDHFKSINDKFGHAAGDAVLVEIAQRLKSNLRAVDLVARIGGEEFLIVMPDIDAATAHSTAKRLCAAVEGVPVALPGNLGDTKTTISIGVAVGGASGLAKNPPRPGTLIQVADEALFGSKSHGRNKVTLARPAA